MKRFLLLLFIPIALFGDEKLYKERSSIVYLTVDQSPAKSIIINWIDEADEAEEELFYKEQEEENRWKKVEVYSRPFPYLPEARIHSSKLTELTPSTIYQFKIGTENEILSFKTVSSTFETPLHFVVGGDCYKDRRETFKKMCVKAANLNPDLVLLGGDLAYAEGRYRFLGGSPIRWITFAEVLGKTMKTSDGHLIPIVAAIGNHDIRGGYSQSPEEAKCFYALFRPFDAKTYQMIDLNDQATLFVLDTGHATAVNGEQKDWLEGALQSKKDQPYKFALYHTPAYPSLRDYRKPRHKNIRNHWVPLFEQYQLTCAFEHHEHAYKRSVPILNNQEDRRGVLYIGDGGWGASARKPAPAEERWYLEKTDNKRHFISVIAEKNRVTFKAYDRKGKVFDQVVQHH